MTLIVDIKNNQGGLLIGVGGVIRVNTVCVLLFNLVTLSNIYEI